MPKLRKRNTKNSGMSLADARKGKSMTTHFCFFCKSAVKAPKETKSILCGNCVLRCAGPDALPASVIKEKAAKASGDKPKKRGRPKGSGNKKGKKKIVKKGKRTRAPNGMGKKYVPSGRPRGWHLRKKFTDAAGIKYSFGVPLKSSKKTK